MMPQLSLLRQGEKGRRMMLAKSILLAAVWQFLLISPAAADAVSDAAAGWVPAAPWPVLALLGLGGVLAALAGTRRFGDAGQRRRDRLHRGRLDQLDAPAAISATDGSIVWANRAARPEGAAPPRSVLDLFASRVDVDARAVYRIATAAMRLGLGAERVSSRGGEGACILAARLDAPDNLAWTLVPAECLPLAAPATGAGQGESVTALEAVPVALIQLDLDGRVRWHNRLAREMIGRDMEPGIPLAELVISLGRTLPVLLADAASDAHGRREMLRLRGEVESFLQISVTRVALDGRPTLLAVLSDASELRQLEDKFVQSQKMEAVGKLAGGVAHDFNNVLTAISGHSDLLLLGKDAQHPDYSDLVQIRQNTHRAAALVRQLLAFSRKQTLNPALLSVQDVVSDIQYLLNRLIGERVTLVLEHGRDLAPVRADQQQLGQALMNLVVNSRDAMPNGGTVTIATRNHRIAENSAHQGFEIPAGDYVEIAVADQGTGIEPHVLDRVFDPFFTTKPQGEGTGLGLSTVYGIVKQSGGYIFAENRAKGGACFRIVLPRAHPAATDTPVPREAPAAERRDLTGKGAILLVEDEDPVRSFASRALRLRGYEVCEAASAEEAMEMIDDPAIRIDLLVSDVVMPGTDGPTLAAHARRKRPGLRVVFISGYAEDSFRRNLVEHDFLFLAKPFSLVELTAKVKEAISGSDASPDG
jgi:two-component system cell cycle sensor histidine kinase/response regulator CckA